MWIAFPDTAAARAALEVASRFCSAALLNHCVRSYLWGAAYGKAHGIAFDDELFYVSAVLHDIGLTPTFDSHTMPFEEAGGQLAWIYGRAADWPVERADRTAEIIVRHMGEDVDPSADAESHLLQVATSWDVSGQRPNEFPAELRTQILDRYPRLDFGAEFLLLFEAQASRKPHSAVGHAIRNGISQRIVANPLDA